MMELLDNCAGNIIAVRAGGRVSTSDYRRVLIPAVNIVWAAYPKVRVYYELDATFAGFDVGAAWEDLSFGLGNLSRWERIAMVTDETWLIQSISLFKFMMPCEIRTFPLAKAADAKAWIATP